VVAVIDRAGLLAGWLAEAAARLAPIPGAAVRRASSLWGVTLYFDGRDIAERVGPVGDVRGYGLETCPGCGLRRLTAYPVCCELVAWAAAG
jgi:hypothetical protein